MRVQTLREAAIKTVARYDIEGATIEKICEQAGASRGLIAHYFESKEALLLDALSNWFESALLLKTAIAQDGETDARERLVKVALSSFNKKLYSWEMAAAWQAFTNASRHNAAYAAPIREASRAIQSLLQNLFREASLQEQKHLDAREAAIGLTILDDGLWNSLATGKDQLTVKQARQCCENYINNILR